MMDRVEKNHSLSEDFRQMLKILIKFGAIPPRMAKEPLKHCKNQTPMHFAVKYATREEVESLGISIKNKSSTNISFYHNLISKIPWVLCLSQMKMEDFHFT